MQERGLLAALRENLHGNAYAARSDGHPGYSTSSPSTWKPVFPASRSRSVPSPGTPMLGLSEWLERDRHPVLFSLDEAHEADPVVLGRFLNSRAACRPAASDRSGSGQDAKVGEHSRRQPRLLLEPGREDHGRPAAGGRGARRAGATVPRCRPGGRCGCSRCLMEYMIDRTKPEPESTRE